MNLFRKIIIFSYFIFSIIPNKLFADNVAAANNTEKNENALRVNKIFVVRKNKNKYLTNEAILNTIPVYEGDIFDQRKTGLIIRNLYNLSQTSLSCAPGTTKPFSYFDQIEVSGELISNNLMNLYIITHEKYEFKEIIINGNSHVTLKDLEKKFKFEDIHAINEIDLKKIVHELRKLYLEKNYHLVDINTELIVEDNKATAIINICENKKSLIKRIHFTGNNCINEKRLKRILFTKEDWILGFLTKGGSYRPDMLEADKHVIENYYKSHGYFMAKVINSDVVMDPETKQYEVTFHINEGDLYTIKSVCVEGGDELTVPEGYLSLIPVRANQLYSAENIRNSLEKLRNFTGRFGYIFADIDPIIIPDEKNKTVDITFNIELANKVYVNRINICGNKKTKDKIIRRRIIINEGDLLTTPTMDESKERIESLGFFSPQNGANWKINKLDDENVDLDLIVNEIKTGRVSGQAGVGGNPTDIQSVSSTFRFGAQVTENNLFGEGIRLNLAGQWSREEWTASLNIADPFFLDKALVAEYDLYVTQSNFSQELRTSSSAIQRIAGTSIGLGFTNPRNSCFEETIVMFKLGIENVTTIQKSVVSPLVPNQATLQTILDRRFLPGTMAVLSNKLYQDTRNNSLHPSRGYRWTLTPKLAPAIDGDLGFAKLELDATWYTPLIDENKLIFMLHGFFGISTNLGKDKAIPYRELFHIGGPTSVRGFLPGQIGPQFDGNSIGGKKAFFLNAELIFPITRDFSMKGAFFYDGGASWDTPDVDLIKATNSERFLTNNRFNYRHAIGFGIRMLHPTPVKVDWGFKLDKRKDEKAYELHLSMYRDF